MRFCFAVLFVLRQVKKRTGRPCNRRHMIQDHTLEARKADRLDKCKIAMVRELPPEGLRG